jgi:hypothetical protein
MKFFRLTLGLISTAAIAGMLYYAYLVFLSDPLANKEEYQSYVTQGLKVLDVGEADWQVLVIGGTREVEGNREKVWEAFSRLEKWGEWGSPMIRSAYWRGEAEWKKGAMFVEDLYLGWPLELFTATEKVEQVLKSDRLTYSRTGGSVRSAHLWRFEFQPGGRTKITSVEVMYGSDIGYLRPIVEKRWQRFSDIALDGLVDYIQKQR